MAALHCRARVPLQASSGWLKRAASVRTVLLTLLVAAALPAPTPSCDRARSPAPQAAPARTARGRAALRRLSGDGLLAPCRPRPERARHRLHRRVLLLRLPAHPGRVPASSTPPASTPSAWRGSPRGRRAEGAARDGDHRRARASTTSRFREARTTLQGRRRACARARQGREGDAGRVRRLRVPVLRRGPPDAGGASPKHAAKVRAVLHAVPARRAPQRDPRRAGGAVRARPRQVLGDARRALREPARRCRAGDHQGARAASSASTREALGKVMASGQVRRRARDASKDAGNARRASTRTPVAVRQRPQARRCAHHAGARSPTPWTTSSSGTRTATPGPRTELTHGRALPRRRAGAARRPRSAEAAQRARAAAHGRCRRSRPPRRTCWCFVRTPAAGRHAAAAAAGGARRRRGRLPALGPDRLPRPVALERRASACTRPPASARSALKDGEVRGRHLGRRRRTGSAR